MFKIAVYYEVMCRNANDNRLMGILHCTTGVEYALFGNVIAASRDEVDMENFILKIATNTSPVYIHCANEETLMAVVCCRRILSLASTALLLDHNKNSKFCDELIQFIAAMYKQEWAYEIHHCYTGIVLNFQLFNNKKIQIIVLKMIPSFIVWTMC